MSTAARTHIGLVRSENEDNFYYDEREQLYIVADGIGGHKGGQEASALAINAFLHFYEQYKEVPPLELLQNAFIFINDEVHEYQEKHFRGSTIGTTFTVAIIREGTLYLGHVGDSRAFILDDEKVVRQISEDHTYLAELAKFDVDANDLGKLGSRNCLLRAIGPEMSVEPQIEAFTFHYGDILILATDGLYRYVDFNEMTEILLTYGELEGVAARFETMALERGGKDNITILIHQEKVGEMSEPRIRGSI